jgi:hypothetical protein
MATIVFLIEQLSTGLYILIAAAIFWLFRSLMNSRRQFREASFGLARDELRFRQANALTFMAVLVQVALIVNGVRTVVAPTLRVRDPNNVAVSQVMDDGVFVTPTPPPVSGGIVIDTSGVELFPTDPADVVFATPTLTPTPVGTILPNPPPVSGCDSPEASLQIPANGMLVFEPVSVIGTAYSPDFAFYRLEISGEGTLNEFRTISQNTSQVVERGGLGQFVPAVYEPGDYQFRVTVYDITNVLRAACMINITISEPLPTATPIGE